MTNGALIKKGSCLASLQSWMQHQEERMKDPRIVGMSCFEKSEGFYLCKYFC
ncbi:hypothetical protein HanRHA438_Chr10g0434171 [Helianthus annuus]|nr:hypothetical protein HanRHA438_Chr10g0434171 [Helianthus annuus]